MQEFLQGIMMGLSVALPFGPLNILIMSHAIHSYKHALITGIGGMGADMFYYFLISIGVLQILHSPEFFKVLGVIGTMVLTYLAYDMYKNANKDIALETNLQKNNFQILLKGFLLNITNPLIIAIWIGIATAMASFEGSYVIAFFGVVVGIGCWITLFPLAIYKSRNIISKRLQKALSYFSALILLFFAISLAYNTFIKGA